MVSLSPPTIANDPNWLTNWLLCFWLILDLVTMARRQSGILLEACRRYFYRACCNTICSHFCKSGVPSSDGSGATVMQQWARPWLSCKLQLEELVVSTPIFTQFKKSMQPKLLQQSKHNSKTSVLLIIGPTRINTTCSLILNPRNKEPNRE